MASAEIFSITSTTAMGMWLLMILAPRWKATTFLMEYKIIPILLSSVYAIYIFISLSSGGGMDFGSLASVMELFTKEDAVLAGWVHYLAFDLLIGMWMLKQNQSLKIHQLLMAPCLFFTFMLGPVGFLLFTAIKSLKK